MASSLKTKVLFQFLFLSILPTCAPTQTHKHGKDTYANFEELSAAQVRGRDYRIVLVDRRAPITALAIHGGDIEPGTSEIARTLAGDDWNLYLFEGLLGISSRRLHITATHFDEPSALSLSKRSGWVVSVHRQRGPGSAACVGGSNASVRRTVAQNLSHRGFQAEEPCRRLAGSDPRNIANQAREGGVQLELSGALIRSLLHDDATMRRFCEGVRSGIRASKVENVVVE